MQRRTRVLVAATGITLVIGSAGLAVTPQAQAEDRTLIPSTTPGWVATAQSEGAAPASQTSQFRVYLAPRGVSTR